MVEIEALAERARRAAEWSRIRMACRVAVVVGLLACVPLIGGAPAAPCACIGVVLLAASALLRWRDRTGVEAVTAGLALGSIPLLAALGLRACGIECAQMWTLSEGELACFAAGALAGAGASFFVARAQRDRRRRWMSTLLIASLTAALGCIGLGAAGVISTLAAVVASATLVWIPVSLRAAS